MKRVTILSLIIILFITGCTTSEKSNPVTESERQKIISFTRQALEIEAKRNELMEYFAPLRDKYGPLGQLWIMVRFLLGGVPASTTIEGPPYNLEGMESLRNRLRWVDCPQSLQIIKQYLLEIYEAEIVLAELQIESGSLPYMPYFGQVLVLCEITKDDLDYWSQLADQYEPWTPLGRQYARVVESDWFKAQEFRLEVYIRWAEILQEHDIDTLEEGFTSLIEYLKE